MLKKSLIALAVLAIALPSFGATVWDAEKYHKPWESRTVYSWKPFATIDVVMDVGYWIEIDVTDSIEVFQDASLGNPFYNYSGCLRNIEVKANFAATLKVSADDLSSVGAGGDWSAKIRLSSATDDSSLASTVGVAANTSTDVDICVTGKNVSLVGLPMTDNLKVAEVTLQVIPTEYADQTS